MGIFADVLFSKTQQRVLAILYGQPYRSFYANEIISLAACGSGAVQRELASLEQSGLLHAWRSGNQKHYQVNHEAPIFEELHGIVVKTFGTAEAIKAALAPVLDQMQAVFIHGDAVAGTVHGGGTIELVTVAPENLHAPLQDVLATLPPMLGRAISPLCYTADTFWLQGRAHDAALAGLLEKTKIFIKGSDADLVKLAGAGA
ncbi:MAG: transcriptional regulator [Burkholderiaceae bacterium]|nr:transcriptional regulator [Burkholderiaceae bacterium]